MSETPSAPEEIAHRLLAEYAGFVNSQAVRFAPAPGLAEDIAQQVCLEFLTKAGRWDFTRDARPLLVGMVRNVARRSWQEYLGRLPEQNRALAEHIRALAENQELPAEDETEHRALRRCLEKLPVKSRELIHLHYELALTSVKIASELGMNPDAVRRALFRLRGQLRQCIERFLAHT